MTFGRDHSEVTMASGIRTPAPDVPEPPPESAPEPEVDIKRFRTERLRSCSAVSGKPFPYADTTVPFIYVDRAGEIRTATSVMMKTEIIAMLTKEGGILLAVWPGRVRSDVFVVDSPRWALEVLWTRMGAVDEPTGQPA